MFERERAAVSKSAPMAGTPLSTVVAVNLLTVAGSASEGQYISSVPITTPRLNGRIIMEQSRIVSKSPGESMLCQTLAKDLLFKLATGNRSSIVGRLTADSTVCLIV